MNNYCGHIIIVKSKNTEYIINLGGACKKFIFNICENNQKYVLKQYNHMINII